MLAASCTVLCVSSYAAAQVDPQGPTLRGAVLDPTGAPVPGADVVIFREGTTVAHVRTDAQGVFTFNSAPREYRVIIRVPGFEVLRSTPIPFALDNQTRFTLQAASTDQGGMITVPVAPVNAKGTHANWEFGVLAQGGIGTEDRSDFKFLLVGGHAGKVLTPTLGSGLFQGNFEYAVELFPFWQSYTPRFQRVSCTDRIPVTNGVTPCSQPYTVGGTYTGVSVTPIILRWNFTHGERWMPWVQGAGGVLWTNHKYPAIGNTNPADTASNGPAGDTSVWNFTPQFGIGTHYFLKPQQSLDFSANAVHISSASLGDKNPGVNASIQFSVGYTWWK